MFHVFYIVPEFHSKTIFFHWHNRAQRFLDSNINNTFFRNSRYSIPSSIVEYTILDLFMRMSAVVVLAKAELLICTRHNLKLFIMQNPLAHRIFKSYLFHPFKATKDFGQNISSLHRIKTFFFTELRGSLSRKNQAGNITELTLWTGTVIQY